MEVEIVTPASKPFWYLLPPPLLSSTCSYLERCLAQLLKSLLELLLGIHHDIEAKVEGTLFFARLDERREFC
jgi:hypothetical protein